MKQQNKNFLYNIAYQLLTFIIPIILTPYVSRVLGVSNVGVYSYSYSIVYYFMLLTMLGINNYGTREIAKCKSKEERSKTFKSIYGLQSICGLISCSLYVLLILLYNYDHKEILIINSLFLISAVFDINWFFFGMEKFKLTTTRNMIIKILSIILVFTLVKNENQLPIYTLILAGSMLVSQLYMWLFLRKEIAKVKIRAKEISKHIKPCLIFFIPVISYSIYRVMDKTMIGAMANSVELGNYESAEKIINIPVSLVTALGTVMLPHMSKKSKDEIKESIYSTFELTAFITIPSAIAIAVIAQDFSVLFFGDGFDKTSVILQALVCTIIFSGIANVIRTNFLIPLKKDKIYVTSTILGAIINLAFNAALIPFFGAYGACVGTILAEFSLMFYQAIKTGREIHYSKVARIFAKYIAIGCVMALAMILVSLLDVGQLTKVLLQLAAGAVVYCAICHRYIIEDFLGRKKVKA